MAKRKRTYYRRSNRFRRFKRIQENYFRVKAEVNGQIRFPDNPGQPQFFLTNRGPDQPRSVLTFGYIVEHQTFAVMLQGMFSFYKIMAISIEATPLASNSNGVKNITREPCTVVAVRAGNDAVMDFGEARSINSSMVLNPLQFQRKYNSLLGFYTTWFSTGTTFSGAVSVVSQDNTGSADNSPEWNFKIVMYMLYKKSKI